MQGEFDVSATVSVDDEAFGLTAGTTVKVTLPYTAKVWAVCVRVCVHVSV